MFLLRFTFENHKSFRDEVDLTMVLPSLKTNVPKSGTWLDHTTRVAAIYGANASGKSCVLDALRYMQGAVAASAPNPRGKEKWPRATFALDESSKSRPSTYILDFVHDDVRYEYGIVMGPKRVDEEWLYTFPTGRRRVVFQRPANAEQTEFGRELGAGGPMLARSTGPRELLLSNGSVFKHSVLSPLRDAIVDEIDIARFGESDRENRLRSVIRDVVDGALSLDDLRTMLRVADIGITGAEVEDPEADPQFLVFYRALLKAQKTVAQETDLEVEDEVDNDLALSDEEVERIYADMKRSLMFQHVGEGDKSYALPSGDQSTGTLTWLSLAAPAIAVIRRGGVLAVDELDASLHPQLAQVMIQMFRDESINSTGAQLIFTTHDTYFMSPTSDVRLNPEEVWFVEKGRNGVSDLYRLSDFATRSDQNLSRRYLQGRYGAVPSVAPSFLAALARGFENDSETNDLELV